MHPACCRGSRWVGFHHPSVLAVSVWKKKQIDHDKTNTEIERQTKNGTCLSKNKMFEHEKCLDHAGFIPPEFLSANFCSKSPNLQISKGSLRWPMIQSMTRMPRLVSIDKHITLYRYIHIVYTAQHVPAPDIHTYSHYDLHRRLGCL